MSPTEWLSSGKGVRIVTAAVLIVLVSAVAGVVALNPLEPEADMTAPAFIVVDLEGTVFELRDHQGEVVLIDFMATWCGICNSTVPALNALYANYSHRGVSMISISVDPAYDSVNNRLKGYAEWHESPWPHALDTHNVQLDYQVRGLPTIVVIDPAGDLAYLVTGPFTYEEIAAELDRLL